MRTMSRSGVAKAFTDKGIWDPRQVSAVGFSCYILICPLTYTVDIWYYISIEFRYIFMDFT